MGGGGKLDKGDTSYITLFVEKLDKETVLANAQQAIPLAGTFSKLNIRLDVAPGQTDVWTFIVMNGVTEIALRCSITGAATSCSDNVNSAAFAAGDLFAIRALDPTPSDAATDSQARFTIVFSQ